MASDGFKLFCAAGQGDDATVKRLLKAKANVNHKESEHGVGSHLSMSLPRTAIWGMTVKEINAAFGERAGELKKPAKRLGLIDMGLIHLFMM